ncbi:glycosylhydrolase-like jelly roll fold domain-containing protein [uncultured Duncaniella sp.]|nr:glycosylhydrolase-like jelly roll fold domain-containing protein [uncultured Duncaniella sp.]
MLDLGDVRESADVKVNDQAAGKVWSVPFTLNIGRFLRPGVNTLEIDVTNLQANRIADFERRGVNWRIFKDANIASVTNAKKFSFGDWPTIPSGLNSKVTLTPLTLSTKN